VLVIAPPPDRKQKALAILRQPQSEHAGALIVAFVGRGEYF
jgi:hypothetical protein